MGKLVNKKNVNYLMVILYGYGDKPNPIATEVPKPLVILKVASNARPYCPRETRMAKPKGEMKKKKGSSKEAAITKSKQEKKKSKNQTSNRSPREPVVLLPSSSSSSSSSDSQEVIETEVEGDETKSGVKNRSTKSPKIKNANNTKRKGKYDDFDGEEEEDGTACRFPMARIKRIIKSEDSDSLLSPDVVFLVNKATEKFLEQFSEEAYDCSVQDRKKSLAYQHLSFGNYLMARIISKQETVEALYNGLLNNVPKFNRHAVFFFCLSNSC